MSKHKISKRPAKIKAVSAEADKTDVAINTQKPKLVSGYPKGAMKMRMATVTGHRIKLKKLPASTLSPLPLMEKGGNAVLGKRK